MATLTTIATGMEKGPEAINANDVALNAELAKVPSMSKWNTTGVTMLNGFNPVDGQPLAYREIKFGTGESLYLVNGEFNLPSVGVPNGTDIQMGSLPVNITPDRGSFLGQAYVLSSAGTTVSVGNVKVYNSSGKLMVTMSPTKGVTMATAPNGWLGVYIAFTGSSIS